MLKKFSQLSYHERMVIERGILSGKSKSKISDELKRPRSCVSREVSKNSDDQNNYIASHAHKMANRRKHRKKPKISMDQKLQEYTIKHLRKRWSPKAIAGRLRNKNKGKTVICAEAIYNWIYGEEGQALGLHKYLIRSKKKRGYKKRASKKAKIKNRKSIHERPNYINERIEYGHFEGDLIFNKGSQSKNLLTLVERTTREVYVVYNKNKTTEEVINNLRLVMLKHRIQIRSITFDNGSEFAGHERLKAIGIATYFCDPGAPWQKGSVEHCNGMLRRYLPFKMHARNITAIEAKKAADMLNNMPRGIFDYKTPLEVKKEKLNV